MARARSDKTTIRYLRTVLRNARSALLVQKDPAVSDGFKRDFAADMVRMIDRELRPRVSGRQRKGGR